METISGGKGREEGREERRGRKEGMERRKTKNINSVMQVFSNYVHIRSMCIVSMSSSLQASGGRWRSVI